MSRLLQIFLLMLAASLGGTLAAQAQTSATQVIDLHTNWNLISIQVGSGMTPTAFKAGLDDPTTPTVNESERLIEIWSYQPSANPAVPGTWQTYQPTVAAFPSDLNSMQPGRGYWVNVSQFAQARLSGVRWDAAVSLQTGWNLVGFPGLDLSTDEAQDLTSVFGSHLSRIPQLWTFDTSLQRFSGYDITAVPQLKELNLIKPAHGYWVYALEPVVITAQPYLALPGDADASPLETEVAFSAPDFPGLPNPPDYVGSLIRKVDDEDEDFDLNGNGIIDSAFTQNVLRFDIGVDRKVITLGNRGTGLANWALANSVSWLFTSPPDAKAYPNNASRPKTASGVVSADRDAVTLYADTTGLLPGLHSGTITIYLGTLVKTITVQLDVPVSSGDWKGYATTQSVNGRAVGIGAVDMGINLFMEEGSSTRFRAVLNKDTSLLFPRDVFMNGVFYSGNQFSLTTNFEMPTGDRNAPPYDTFQKPANYDSLTGAAKARADYDANGDRKLDASNPFPFPVRREVTLLGTRKTPDRMEGSYIESITGMLPAGQPIFIQGTFFLDRQTFDPTKRSIFNQTTTSNPIIIGSTSGPLFRESTIQVTNAVTISGLSLTLNVTFPQPTLLTITLTGPNGQVVTVHKNGGTIPGSVDLSEFNGLIGTGAWKIRVAWTATGERGYFNSWGLNLQGLATYSITGKIAGDLGSGTPTPLAGAHVVLTGSNIIEQTDTGPFVVSVSTQQGQSGVSLTSGTTAGFYPGMAITGHTHIPPTATVSSITGPTTLILTANATGSSTASTTFGTAGVFSIPNLTENNYTLAISRPGFETRLIPVFLSNASLYVGETGASPLSTMLDTPILLAPVTVPAPELRAGPFIGQEPLFVSFTALVPVADLAAIGTVQTATWDFGDGSPPITDTALPSDDIAQTTAKHSYAKAGDYTATLTLTGTSGSPLLVPLAAATPQIHVQRARPDPDMPLLSNGQPAGQAIAVSFLGSLAAPLTSVGDPVQLAASGTTAQTLRIRQIGGTYVDALLPAIASATVPQESKPDTASFDIDRSNARPRSVPPISAVPATANFHPTAEDSDFTGHYYLLWSGTEWIYRTYAQLTTDERDQFLQDNSPGTFSSYEPDAVGGVPNPERYRMFTTHGSYVFGTAPSQVGDIVLQAGRTEP